MKKNFDQRVTSVIPNYNGLELLKKNLFSVLEALRDGDELLIVDDASTDQSVPWLSQEFGLSSIESSSPHLLGKYQKRQKTVVIRVLKNRENMRFAMTVNRGVQAASSSYIFLLNNDVSPQKDVLQWLLPYFADESVFGVAPLEIENGFKSGKNRIWFEKGMFLHSKAKDFSKGKTAWISGGSGVFDKNKWLKIHGFDSRFYPAYWEDIDLSFRAQKMGWKTLFEPNARVQHNHESTNKSAFGAKKIMRMSWKNSDQFTWKNAHFMQKIVFVLWRPYWWCKRFLVLIHH